MCYLNFLVKIIVLVFVRDLAVPADSDLALNLQRQEEADRREKERVKQLTLEINERQEEEDLNEAIAAVIFSILSFMQQSTHILNHFSCSDQHLRRPATSSSTTTTSSNTSGEEAAVAAATTPTAACRMPTPSSAPVAPTGSTRCSDCLGKASDEGRPNKKYEDDADDH